MSLGAAMRKETSQWLHAKWKGTLVLVHGKELCCRSFDKQQTCKSLPTDFLNDLTCFQRSEFLQSAPWSNWLSWLLLTKSETFFFKLRFSHGVVSWMSIIRTTIQEVLGRLFSERDDTKGNGVLFSKDELQCKPGTTKDCMRNILISCRVKVSCSSGSPSLAQMHTKAVKRLKQRKSSTARMFT